MEERLNTIRVRNQRLQVFTENMSLDGAYMDITTTYPLFALSDMNITWVSNLGHSAVLYEEYNQIYLVGGHNFDPTVLCYFAHNPM